MAHHAASTLKYGDILKISLPIIAGSAIENLTAIFNTAFLGRVGPIALGAVAIGGIFYMALVMIGFGFGIGTQIIVARRFGEKNLKEIGHTLHHSAIFLLPLAIVIFCLVQSSGNYFFHSFLKSKEVETGVIDFMNYRIWGILFAFINILFKAFYIGIQKTKIIGLSSLLIAVMNIVFDYSLIFGHFGFLKMGVAGAGLASVIAEVTGTIFFIIYSMSRSDISEFRITKFSGFDYKLLGKIFKIASPVMFQFSISFGGWFVFFALVEQMGEIPLAVSNIIRTFYMIVLLPLWGYASATNTLVSYKIGSNKVNEIGPLVRRILILSIASVSTLVFLTDIFSHFIFRLYTDNLILIQACYPVLVVVSVSSILVSTSVILFNVVSGAGKTMVSLFTESIVISIYIIWTYLMVHSGKATTAKVWTSEILYGFIMGTISALYLKYGNWKKSSV